LNCLIAGIVDQTMPCKKHCQNWMMEEICEAGD